MTTTMKFTVVGPMTSGDFLCHVHKAGCADLRNLRTYRNQDKHTKYTVAAETALDAAFATVCDTDLGYTATDVKVFPCCEEKAELEALPELEPATLPVPEDYVAAIAAETGLTAPSDEETTMSDQAAPEIEFDQTVPEAEPTTAPAPEAETAEGGVEWADVGLSTPTGLTEKEKEMAKKSARKMTPAPKPGKAPKTAKGKKMTEAEKLALSAKVGAQTKKMAGGKTAKAAKKAVTPKAPKTAKAVAPKAPKVKRLELTSRQREVLREDAKDSGLKADVEAGKQIRLTAGAMKDITAFAGSDKDATRQRVYTGLLARCEAFVKENGLLTL